MDKTKYNFYNRSYCADIIIVCISLVAVMWGSILNGAYISAIIIILSTLFLLGKIRYLSEDIPKEDVFYVEECSFFSMKLFGNYIQYLTLVPIETVRKNNGATIYGTVRVLSISKIKFKVSDCLHCRFVNEYHKGSFIQFYKAPIKEKEDS